MRNIWNNSWLSNNLIYFNYFLNFNIDKINLSKFITDILDFM